MATWDAFYEQFDDLTDEQKSAVFDRVVDAGLDANDPAVMTDAMQEIVEGRSTSRGRPIPEGDKFYMDRLSWKYDKPLLTRPDLRDRELHGITFRKKALPGADLGGAVLDGIDMTEVDLRGAYLVGADFSRADLHKANLQDANLQDAILQDADLNSANLRGADLRDADLRGANFWGTKMESARLMHDDMGDSHLKPEKMVSMWLLQNSDARGFRFNKAEQKQLREIYQSRANKEAYSGESPLSRVRIPLAIQGWLADTGIEVRLYDTDGRVHGANPFGIDVDPPGGKLAYSSVGIGGHLVNVPDDIEVYYLRGDKVFLTGEGVPDDLKRQTIPRDIQATWAGGWNRDKGVIVTLPTSLRNRPISFDYPAAAVEVSLDDGLDAAIQEVTLSEVASPDSKRDLKYPLLGAWHPMNAEIESVEIDEDAVSVTPVEPSVDERESTEHSRPQRSPARGFTSQAPAKPSKPRKSRRHPFWSRKESRRR